MRAAAPLIAVVAALALAACGAAKPTRTSTSSSATTPAPAPAPAPAKATSTTTAARPRARPKASARPAALTGPELPASYSVGPGGVLSPPQVSAPGRTPILVTVSSRTGRYRVALGTPRGQQLNVTPGHPGRVLLTGLHNGTYSIDIDGHPRGELVVGVRPGP